MFAASYSNRDAKKRSLSAILLEGDKSHCMAILATVRTNTRSKLQVSLEQSLGLIKRRFMFKSTDIGYIR